MVSYTMLDDSILTVAQIEAHIRDVERSVARIERLEKILGPLHVDSESVRLQLRDLRRQYSGAES